MLSTANAKPASPPAGQPSRRFALRTGSRAFPTRRANRGAEGSAACSAADHARCCCPRRTTEPQTGPILRLSLAGTSDNFWALQGGTPSEGSFFQKTCVLGASSGGTAGNLRGLGPFLPDKFYSLFFFVCVCGRPGEAERSPKMVKRKKTTMKPRRSENVWDSGKTTRKN